jgi:ATP-dependent Clp protease ATP-binding subunit ClpA
VLQRAVFHVQSSGKKEVTGANVLVAIFGEKESPRRLSAEPAGVTRLDVVNFISTASPRSAMTRTGRAPKPAAKQVRGRSEARARATARSSELRDQPQRAGQEGKIDPLIGRQDEVERTIRCCAGAARTTRSRRRGRRRQDRDRRRPGASRIVEGKTCRGARGLHRDLLARLGALLAGTKYRGDFEKRSRPSSPN